MSRQVTNWIVIVAVLLITAINPLYRYSKQLPIVTLGLDLKGGVEVLLKAEPEKGAAATPEAPSMGGAPEAQAPAGRVTPEQLEGAKEVIRNRIDPQGTKELYLTTVGTDRILVQVPGEKNPQQIIDLIGKTALLEFIDSGSESIKEGTDLNDPVTGKRTDEYAKYETLLTGKDLKRSDVEMQNGPVIGFEFKQAGGDIFGNFTNNHVGKYLTIALDGKVLTSPVIKGPIWGNRGIIEGKMTYDEVEKIVRQLNAGALPVPLTILSNSIVGPTLGAESIHNSFIAGLVGVALVLVFMMLFYRLPGVIASVALILYIIIVLGTLSLINATLTLPGIAGFLLSIGMAVDANIIIFERLKEEIRWGKTLVAAMDAAFARAWVAILDGHITLLLAASVLYFLGSGPVRGFAVTLFFGATLALYSGVFVTRTFMDFMVRHVKKVSLYAPHTGELEIPTVRLRAGHYYHFVEKTSVWVTISAIVILTGVGFMVFNSMGRFHHAFNLGIDYTGGQTLQLVTKDKMPVDGQALSNIVAKYSEGESVVQVNANDTHKVSIRRRPKGMGAQEQPAASSAATESLTPLLTEIGNAFGGYKAIDPGQNPQVKESSYVGPTVGAELIRNAIIALIIGSLLIMFYIWIRFLDPLVRAPMAVAAIASLLHDVLLTLSVTAILGLEVNSSFIAVILTIIGYSINDTIIIFDRIRENLRNFGGSAPLAQLSNLSLTQTLTRSLFTVFTVLFMAATLLVFGGMELRAFMLAMFAGLLSGMYSSIYIAVPIMLWMSKGRVMLPAGAVATAGAGGGGMALGAAAAPVLEPESEQPSGVERQVEAARERRERKAAGKQQRRR